MNQLLKTAIAERECAASSSARPATIDYDDGEPATIRPATQRRAPNAHAGAPAGDATARSSLAEVTRDAAIDYDDGDPATILC